MVKAEPCIPETTTEATSKVDEIVGIKGNGAHDEEKGMRLLFKILGRGC